ncbi:MAG: methyl-accepting chemotaxis protein [Planctomycetaceae bacterium]
MKLKTLLLTSHVTVAALAAAGSAGLAGAMGTMLGMTAGLLAAPIVAGVVGGIAAMRMSEGIENLNGALSSNGHEDVAPTGIAEFDKIASIVSDRERSVASSLVCAQQQLRDVQKLVMQLDRRGEAAAAISDQSTGSRLRNLLAATARAADADLKRLQSLTGEIEEDTRSMSAGASDQSQAVSKTTTYVEQMSANIDLVTQNADAANHAADAVRECSADAQKIIRELIDGMERIRRHVEAGWRKLRALGDRTQEIGSIVETIAGIAARTDMLALNASIESVRAGEHGRGFAVVADEVRKLAEQAAQATREVAGLIETVQTETQESIDVMAREHSQVETEVGRVNSAGESLERISSTSSDSVKRVGEITRATQQQLRFTQEVVLAMERISEAARGIRGRAEGVSWTTNTLSVLVRQLDSSLEPLRGCIDRHSAANGDADGDAVLREARGLADKVRESATPVARPGRKAEQGAANE